MKQTFFFYDLETSGLSARSDRIMQFAGQRTDLDLKPIGPPINLLIKLTDDTLPSPAAIAVTKILPEHTLEAGLTEPEFCKLLIEEYFTRDTIIAGYNSVRFDDEFIRFLFWRNFHDPYLWQWKDGRSRWDLLDVVRMVRALRPDGIKWPLDDEGNPTNRLELITKVNNISHESAHDALSDVNALISVTRLIKEKQPNIYNFLLNIRDKHSVASIVNPLTPAPFVYTSGRCPSTFNKTTVAFPLFSTKTGGVYIYDLRYDIEDLLSMKVILANKSPEELEAEPNFLKRLFPAVKELQLNKCPAVAPVSVLDHQDGWAKISLEKKQVEKNLASLKNRSEIVEIIRSESEEEERIFENQDVESSLYVGFLSSQDAIKCQAVRNADVRTLTDFHPEFIDCRLPELLLHYKARNFPDSLSKDEAQKWQDYRTSRLKKQEPDFLNSLKELSSDSQSDLITSLQKWHDKVM